MKLAILPLLLASGAIAQQTPIVNLVKQADVIAFARIDHVIDSGGTVGSNVVLQLGITRVLQGEAPSGSVFAQVAAQAGRRLGPLTMSVAFQGQTGVWFLQKPAEGSANYRILPRNPSTYSASEIFLPAGDQADPAAPVPTQLLQEYVAWYLTLPETNQEGPRFQQAVRGLDRDALWAATNPLWQSSDLAQRITGLSVGVAGGLPDALDEVVRQFGSLPDDQRRLGLMQVIQQYPETQKTEWLAPLERFLDAHGGESQVDLSVAAALTRIRTKASLPLLIRLLDSKDEQVAPMIALDLGLDLQGASKKFLNEQTKLYTPPQGAGTARLPSQQYADFWKSWWMENGEAIMNPPPPSPPRIIRPGASQAEVSSGSA